MRGPRIAQPDFSGNQAKGEQIAQRHCAPCHSINGISVSAQFPNLAGQLSEYLVKQIKAFRASQTAKPLRPNPVMTPRIAALTDTDLQDLVAYYSRRHADHTHPGSRCHRLDRPVLSVP